MKEKRHEKPVEHQAEASLAYYQAVQERGRWIKTGGPKVPEDDVD